MKLLLPLACTALLTCCAAPSATRYPSLLPRPIEARSDAEPVDTPPPAATPDPALDARLAALGKDIDAASAAFAPAAARAERAARAARGDAAGGERWIAAQSLLAELDGYRATTSAALTDIEQLALDRAAAGAVDYPALATLRETTQAALDAQTARIAAIQAMLPAA